MKTAIAGIALALALGLGGCATMEGMMGGGDGAEAASEPASAMTAQPEAAASAPADACAPADPAAPSSTDAPCPPAEPSAAPAPQQQ